jgi:NADH:ubiquinone oxidoreductase subunit 4 (subunit M)
MLSRMSLGSVREVCLNRGTLDSLRLFLATLLFVVFVVIYPFLLNDSSARLCVSLYGLLVLCYGAFVTNNIVFFYFFYEASLVPIVFIILQ